MKKYEIYFDNEHIQGWYPIEVNCIIHPENIPKYIKSGVLKVTEVEDLPKEPESKEIPVWVKDRPDYACVFVTRHRYKTKGEYNYSIWRFEWQQGEPPNNLETDENTAYYYLAWNDDDGLEWDDMSGCDYEEYLVLEKLKTLEEMNKENVK